jgi:tRNA(His) guanylyltransferase
MDADNAAPLGSVRADQFEHFYLPNGRHRMIYQQQRGVQYAETRPAKSNSKKDSAAYVEVPTSPTLLYPPSFDGRIVCYPSDAVLRDYLSWRQVDYHINNLYNTCFWHLVLDGYSVSHAEERLKGTFSEDKNEILFNEYDTNYARLPAVYRKGSVLLWSDHVGSSLTQDKASEDADAQEPPAKRVKHNGTAGETKPRRHIVVLHEDLIQDGFWTRHAGLIPYVSATQNAREALKAEKKKRKELHKEVRLRLQSENKQS